MPKVTIYTTPICPYCVRAKALFARKGVAVEEVNIFSDDTARREMQEKSGGMRTVPQIFIGERHIGGCDDLYALDAAGGLDPLLK